MVYVLFEFFYKFEFQLDSADKTVSLYYAYIYWYFK